MKYYLLYLLLRLLFNPLGALLLVIIIYIAIDRRFIGILPDIAAPYRKWRRLSALRGLTKANCLQADALYELGVLLVEKGETRQGLESLQRAESLMPDHPEIHYYLGRAFLSEGSLEEARISLEKALEINPKVKYGAPYVYLLEYAARKGDDDSRLQQYLEKVEEYGSPEFCYKAGLILKRYGHKELARDMFSKAVVDLNNYPAFYRKKHRYWSFRARIQRFLT